MENRKIYEVIIDPSMNHPLDGIRSILAYLYTNYGAATVIGEDIVDLARKIVIEVSDNICINRVNFYVVKNGLGQPLLNELLKHGAMAHPIYAKSGLNHLFPVIK